MYRRSLPLLGFLGALVALGACDPGEPTGTIFEPPLALEGSYSGTVLLTLRGTAHVRSLSEQAALEMQSIDSIYNVKGRAQIGPSALGGVEGTYVGRDSSIVPRLLGPTQRQALGWAAFLPALVPQCDWFEAEVGDATMKASLERITLEGHVNILCADETLNLTAAPEIVLVEVSLDVRKTGRDPGAGS